MLLTSLPQALDHKVGIPGIVISMVLVGTGVGGIKPTVNAFIGMITALNSSIHPILTRPLIIGDQYSNTKYEAIMTKGGRIVVIDRTMTLQYIDNVLYWLAVPN